MKKIEKIEIEIDYFENDIFLNNGGLYEKLESTTLPFLIYQNNRAINSKYPEFCCKFLVATEVVCAMGIPVFKVESLDGAIKVDRWGSVGMRPATKEEERMVFASCSLSNSPVSENLKKIFKQIEREIEYEKLDSFTKVVKYIKDKQYNLIDDFWSDKNLSVLKDVVKFVENIKK